MFLTHLVNGVTIVALIGLLLVLPVLAWDVLTLPVADLEDDPR